METLDELFKCSATPRELVLTLDDALRALTALENTGVKEIGWEGWLRYSDGALGHSGHHQGTAGLFSIEECRSTMREAQAQWAQAPEVDDAELLFCLTW